jgi:hypothetical protein
MGKIPMDVEFGFAAWIPPLIPHLQDFLEVRWTDIHGAVSGAAHLGTFKTPRGDPYESRGWAWLATPSPLLDQVGMTKSLHSTSRVRTTK